MGRGIGAGDAGPPRLRAAAAAKLDQSAILAQGAGHFGGVRLEDGQLGASQVILVQFTDLVKERGPALVVEVFARQFLARLAEAA